MNFRNKIVWFVVFVTEFRKVVGDVPIFRVLAPEFLCPNDENAAIDQPDNTIITVKTDAIDLQLSWTVRWVHLDQPSQRFTLLLWKTVRALEAKLNGPQPEPFVYVIDNAELLEGVEYVFNVTGTDPQSNNSTTKTFSIDNIRGDSTLLIEGRSEKMSVLLIGGDVVYADMEYIVEAVVTTCTPTQDYYFEWNIQSSFASPLNDLGTSGSRLEIPPYSLQAGASYYVSCSVYRNSGEFVTQTSLPVQVLNRGLTVSLNFDVLVVTANKEFNVRALIENHDHYGEKLEFEWTCSYENEPCENFERADSEILTFPQGLPLNGQYEINFIVTTRDQQASSNASIIIIKPALPVIQIEPHHRLVNEHTVITLIANASDVVPACTLTWYFAKEEHLASLDYNCDDCQHGEELPGSVTITSLEENFLNELADIFNQTESRQMMAHVTATTGRARFVARCECSFTSNCDAVGTAYADVNFVLNESPKVFTLIVSPETGAAMETVFRLSTVPASDPDKPLRYTFYCSLGTNDTLILASNLEHLAVEIFLPFIDSTGTKVWVEICDSIGACSSSEATSVQLLEGDGRTVDTLVASLRGHVARCEMLPVMQLVQSAVTTYINANQEEIMIKFTQAFFETVSTTEDRCIKNIRDYFKLLDWLTKSGVGTSSLIESRIY